MSGSPESPKPKKPKNTNPLTEAPLLVEITYLDRKWSIEGAALDDWELLETLASDSDGTAAPKAVKALLGEHQYNELKEILRNESGRVPATRFVEALGELFSLLMERIESGNL